MALAGLVVWLRNRKSGGLVVLLGLLLSLPVAGMGVGFDLSARMTPPINDISTDTQDPPVFWFTVTPTDYPSANSELQRTAYPDVRPLDLDLPFDDAFALALALVEERGWQVLSADLDESQIEAIATSRLFGFEDEVAVRVTETDNGIRIDMRSRSRLGRLIEAPTPGALWHSCPIWMRVPETNPLPSKGNPMDLKPFLVAASVAFGSTATPLFAQEAAIEAMQEYMMFSDYESGIILPQQIDQTVFETALFVDTRDAGQFEVATIPSAVNIEWREVLDRIDEIPEDRMTILFCNTGSLSAQAAFALRVAGRTNVVVMQTGFSGWQKDAAWKP